MKHIKKHFKRLHRIKIHDNRWLIWTIAIIVVVCVSLLTYIRVSTDEFEQKLADFSYLSKNGVLYRDAQFGFALRHPRDWGVEAESNNIIHFNNPYNFGEGITVGVYEPSDENALRKNFSIRREENVSIDGNAAKLLTINNNGNFEGVAMVVKNNKLYVMRGNTKWFEYVLSTFTFFPKS